MTSFGKIDESKNANQINTLRSDGPEQSPTSHFLSAEKTDRSNEMFHMVLRSSRKNEDGTEYDPHKYSSDMEVYEGPTIKLRKKTSSIQKVENPSHKVSAEFGIEALLASTVKLQADKIKDRRKSQVREKFGFVDIDNKLRFNSAALLRPDSGNHFDKKFTNIQPKKQFGRNRSLSFQKAYHVN